PPGLAGGDIHHAAIAPNIGELDFPGPAAVRFVVIAGRYLHLFLGIRQYCAPIPISSAGFARKLLAPEPLRWRILANSRESIGRLRAGRFMSRLGTMIWSSFVVSLPLGLGGCAGVLLVGGLGAAAGGGYIAAEERGISGNSSDFAIKTRIAQGFLNSNPSLQQGVTTS